MKTGIFGGSFNPVHNGHVNLALRAADEFGFDRVYFVPSGISPHHKNGEYVSSENRLEMLRLVCERDKRLHVSDYEIRHDRISYTLFTIEYFRSLFPDDELYLLVGSDMLLSFESWYRYDEILKQCTLTVISRNDGDMDELEKMACKLRRYGSVIIAKAEPVEISSTEIRKKIRKNQEYSCYLDKNVVQYIRSEKLYL